LFKVEYCKTFYTCFFIAFDHVFKDNGGLGGWITVMLEDDGGDYELTGYFPLSKAVDPVTGKMEYPDQSKGTNPHLS
jgi:hypothetical protein